MNPDCQVCVHSRPVISDVAAEGPLLKCYRYPPVLVVINGEPVQLHPDADESCGEWASS